ncbi:5'-3' exonuclease H3TH domain-containing protein [Fontisphaera persica]|uniref:5'-3' exonuclease n=1 Tax=Fontisphaera persica TaxID=2974023 RepID=UPI0024BF2352|nr:5'-3' exonuclease H3TH domain-containing protein [Fontisphaera persica]WCJ58718.1 5'-3' exonuclease H3TH domain-containing protein [Fontisphaera persica]
MFPRHKRLLLVDGHAFAYRAFHAIRNLAAPDGSPTNAIFGFIKTLGKMQAQWQPEFLQVAWDGGMAAERLSELPEYKAQRPPMPDALARQLDGIQAWLEAAGLASFCQDGVEADDWIATASRQAVEQGAAVIIASPDKDFMQLVSPQVALLNPNDDAETLWTPERVVEKTGVQPGQVVDWLSLIGDSVDNIRGVEGVGPKTAAKLLQQFGTINAIFEHLNDLNSDTLRTALQAAEAVVRRNQRLIRLNDRLPGQVDLERLRPGRRDARRLRELYAQWGFRSLLKELGPAIGTQGELF